MKNHTSGYIAIEEGQKKKPIELYHFWRDGGTNWYYTSHNAPIIYDTHTYTPATITRGTAKYDTQFEVSKLTIQFTYISDPVVEYISQNPVELIWVEIRRYFADLPTETSVVFIGQIKTVSFDGNVAGVQCVGFEHWLNTRIPRYRWQVSCNNDLFDARCSYGGGPTAAAYQINPTITTVEDDGTSLTSTTFSAQANGYYTRGYIKWGDYHRMIVDHTGSVIKIRFSMPGFTAGQSIYAYPGCDKLIGTCIDKFSNQLNFFGHPYIPLDNPSTWAV
jgi:uncharacterized phage protein (TIGR02218 family)